MKKTSLTKTQKRITLDIPTDLLKDVDWLAPLEDLTRDELILEAVRRFLKPHLEIRKKVLRADSGKTHGHTAEEMTAFLRKRLKKKEAGKPVIKAISESAGKSKPVATNHDMAPVDENNSHAAN
jgi:hypothetical protein